MLRILVGLSLVAVACSQPVEEFAVESDAVLGGSSDDTPFVVYFAGTKPGERRAESFCSGTLIRRDVVLTAAHCAFGRENVGVGLRKDARDGTERLRKGRFVLHPDYVHSADDRATPDDIALFVLDEPVTGVEPAELVVSEVPLGTRVRAIGYGRSARTGERDGGYGRRRMHEGVVSSVAALLMVRGTNGTTCDGDSGGPLLLTNTNKVVGTLSHGFGACREPVRSTLDRSGFTATSFYREFLAKHLNGGSPLPGGSSSFACGSIVNRWACASGNARFACDAQGRMVTQNCGLGCLAGGTREDASCIDEASGASCAWSERHGAQRWTCAERTLFKCVNGAPQMIMCPNGCTAQGEASDDRCN